MEVTLYHYWDAVCAMKSRFAIAEKGVAHELIHVDLLAFEQLRPDYLALNPNGVVPTLVHNGVAIIESSVINEYIDEAFDGPPLMPSDPIERARVRTLVRLEDGKMHECFRAPTFHLMIKPLFADRTDEELEQVAATHPQKWVGEYWKKAMRSEVDETAVEKGFNDLRLVMAKLEAVLADGRDWLGGAHVTLAEASFFSLVDRVESLGRGDLFTEFVRLDAWRARLKTRPGYAAATPQVRMFQPPGSPHVAAA